MAAEGHPETKPGTPVILTGYDGAPQAVVRITDVRATTFGDIGPAETGLDGPPVQDIEVWRPLHRDYWNGLLSQYGKSCTDDMPVLVDRSSSSTLWGLMRWAILLAALFVPLGANADPVS